MTQFGIAYDVYLDILHHVDKQVKEVLGQTSPDWRLLNSCPACEYKLQDEPTLPFSKLIAIDGNNSLRHIDPSQTKSSFSLPDSCIHMSDVWLTPGEVNQFQYEVQARPKKLSNCSQSSTIVDIAMHEGEGDVTNGVPEAMVCVECRKAAAPDERKKMWNLFSETGIFIAVCRHGFILLLCDMVQSGELQVFPVCLKIPSHISLCI